MWTCLFHASIFLLVLHCNHITALYVSLSCETNKRINFTKRITLLCHLTNLKLISILELKQLELWRLCFDLIQHYTITYSINQFLLIIQIISGINMFSSSRTLSPFIIKPINSPNNLLKYFFQQIRRLMDFT